MSVRSARFFPGQQVQHRFHRYRGVIFDVDPIFLGSDRWYEQMSGTRPPREDPWYHVLVHGEEHTAYVAEVNLDPYEGDDSVEHPLLDAYFDGVTDGIYRMRSHAN